MRPARRAGVLALALIAAVLLSIQLHAAKRAKPGDVCKSETKLFQVTAPKGCSSFSQYEMVAKANKKDSEFFDEVILYVPAMGEMYRAGVRRVTPSMRQEVQQSQGTLDAAMLATLGVKLHLAEREKLPMGPLVPPLPSTGQRTPLGPPETVVTKHGQGIMSVQRVQDGRLLVVVKLQKDTQGREAGPGLIVVLVVQSGDHLIYVTGQADASGGFETMLNPEKNTPDCVQARLREMIDSLVVARALGSAP